MTRPTAERLRSAQLSLLVVYITMGHAALSTVAWVPEFIDRLNVSFATWGTIVGFGIIGTIAPLLFASRIIMRFGSRPVIRGAIYAAMFMLIALSWTNEPLPWFFINAGFGFTLSTLGLAVNSHSVLLQKQLKGNVLGKIHAGWSAGALLAALTGAASTVFLDLEFYLILVAGITILIFEFALRGLLSPSEDGHKLEKAKTTSRKFYQVPPELWLLCIGIFTGTFAEAVLIDWSAVFARDALSLEPSLRSIPFAAFMIGMIIGRLSMSRLTRRLHPSELAKYGAFIGAALLLANSFLSPQLAANSVYFGLVINATAFFLAGLSMSALAPSFFAAAGHVPNVNTASALATMSLFNSVVSIGAKTIVGGIAEGIGIEVVFVFPALLLIAAGFIAGKVAKRAKASELDTAYRPTGPLQIISD